MHISNAGVLYIIVGHRLLAHTHTFGHFHFDLEMQFRSLFLLPVKLFAKGNTHTHKHRLIHASHKRTKWIAKAPNDIWRTENRFVLIKFSFWALDFDFCFGYSGAHHHHQCFIFNTFYCSKLHHHMTINSSCVVPLLLRWKLWHINYATYIKRHRQKDNENDYDKYRKCCVALCAAR